MLNVSHCDSISCRVSILLDDSSTMSSKFPYLRISGVIPSDPANLSCIRFSVTLLYSSVVKSTVFIARVLSLIVLICMKLFSCSCLSPSSFLKCSYHLLTRTSFLRALISPLFGFLRLVSLLINFQLSKCILCSLP